MKKEFSRLYSLGFSSMGAPDMELRDLESLAGEFTLDFLELRTLGGSTRLADYFQTHPESLRERSIPIRVVSTDLRLSSAGEKEIADFLVLARLADALGAPYVRVFGGGEWSESFDADVMAKASKTIGDCRNQMQGEGIKCNLLLETHSGFSASERCARLCERVKDPLFILWDSHHTWKLAGETAEESWKIIGPHVRHIHVKDSISVPSPQHPYSYAFQGQGEFPTAGLLRLLRAEKYSGGLSLEWEKLWYPDLPDLQEALAAFYNQVSAG